MNFYRLSNATFYDCINTIYQFIKPFLDKKYLFWEKSRAFNDVITFSDVNLNDPLQPVHIKQVRILDFYFTLGRITLVG